MAATGIARSAPIADPDFKNFCMIFCSFEVYAQTSPIQGVSAHGPGPTLNGRCGSRHRPCVIEADCPVAVQDRRVDDGGGSRFRSIHPHHAKSGRAHDKTGNQRQDDGRQARGDQPGPSRQERGRRWRRPQDRAGAPNGCSSTHATLCGGLYRYLCGIYLSYIYRSNSLFIGISGRRSYRAGTPARAVCPRRRRPFRGRCADRSGRSENSSAHLRGSAPALRCRPGREKCRDA